MHVSLQDKSKFSLLGQYRACLRYGQKGVEEDDLRNSCAHGVDGVSECSGRRSRGCLKFDGILGQRRQTSKESSYWIELAYDSLRLQAKGIHWVPKLHHLHWKREIVSQCDVHVILYETPIYGVHHFSLRNWNSCEHEKASLKKLQWVDELQQKQPLNDMDTVVLAINNASAAQNIFERHDSFKQFPANIPIVSIDLTNGLLRSGSVWLMGVPAVFKSPWIFVGSLFIYFIKGLAILAILFGVTIPVALVIDIIAIVTLHVSTLHWLISILYSQQLHALAALWRIFRGRKWNPLRQRLDSFDYTVKQHVVGSLLLTPLLLLLPTTSVFYIFFSIMNTTISLSCMFIEVIISVHATPYIKIALRLLKPRRFPLGIWFEIIAYHNNSSHSPCSAYRDRNGLPVDEAPQKEDLDRMVSSVLISILHSNYLSIGQIVLTHYRKAFSGVSRSYISASVFGLLSEVHLLWEPHCLQQCHGCVSHTRSIGVSVIIRFLDVW
ncbi:N-acetylglucosaminyl transferase component family protein / Gpi1 family protein, putative isoform 2 [Hibiscus syriacus]|uniref:N-acetylglucosaminyl transferase component family protein / Gpi1 family protein, putative isoform 2 n=1 Tax=Hibiscus syriacus TaxID=106335 RepID=A0A6A3CLE8_HIBSY|nr:N-acetylglucosaminyl transferase component family protein / Gpi1 family protein, putative isoform 2 [Hibiscus syriacus]